MVLSEACDGSIAKSTKVEKQHLIVQKMIVLSQEIYFKVPALCQTMRVPNSLKNHMKILTRFNPLTLGFLVSRSVNSNIF